MQQARKDPFWVRGFHSFISYRELLRQLVAKDFKKKYKRSALGYLWSILNPLLTMLVLVMVFQNVLGIKVENFPIYLLTGQLMFGMMSESTNAAMTSITDSAALIQQVYVPKFILPLSSVASALINQLFSFMALVVVMIFTQYLPPPTALLFFVPIVYQLLFCIGLGLCLATAMVFFSDTKYLYGVLLTLWTYMTPIFYTSDILPPFLAQIIKVVNPMYHYVTYMRNLILDAYVPHLFENLVCLGYGLVMLVLGISLFYTQQRKFIFHI